MPAIRVTQYMLRTLYRKIQAGDDDDDNDDDGDGDNNDYDDDDVHEANGCWHPH